MENDKSGPARLYCNKLTKNAKPCLNMNGLSIFVIVEIRNKSNEIINFGSSSRSISIGNEIAEANNLLGSKREFFIVVSQGKAGLKNVVKLHVIIIMTRKFRKNLNVNLKVNFLFLQFKI